jgi:hypothetical protein
MYPRVFQSRPCVMRFGGALIDLTEDKMGIMGVSSLYANAKSLSTSQDI